MPVASAPTVVSPAPPEAPPVVRTVAVVDLEALAVPTAETRKAEPPAEATAADEEPPPSRLVETDSEAWEWSERRTVRTTSEDENEDEDRAWVRAAAEAARAIDTSGSATRPLDQVTIATSSVDGRVKRVRPGTIEVSDREGNVYELHIDGRSRGLRRGRHIPLKAITEGMSVRASFDLVGDGESRARDIEVRR
ncbi:MAG TPA: hypothetical protein VF794_27020 [Archangium sp.]